MYFSVVVPESLALLEPKRLWRWYRDSLSGFLDTETVQQCHNYDFEVFVNGNRKTIRVPIFSLADMGEDMAIDEKKIGESRCHKAKEMLKHLLMTRKVFR